MKCVLVSAASFALLALLSGAGCGGSTDDAGSTGGSSSTGGAAASGCPNVAGSWKVAKHCQSALVGTTVQVGQSGCAFTDQTYGFTGTLHGDGTLTVSSGAANATCSGTVSASRIIESCTVAGQPCDVTLTR